MCRRDFPDISPFSQNTLPPLAKTKPPQLYGGNTNGIGLTQRTPQEYSRLKEIHALSFAEKPLSRIGLSELKAYRADLIARGFSGSTVRLNLALISAIFSHAKKESAINTDYPALTIKKPKPGKARPRRPLPGEEERLMKALAHCRYPHVERTIRFLLETDLRNLEGVVAIRIGIDNFSCPLSTNDLACATS